MVAWMPLSWTSHQASNGQRQVDQRRTHPEALQQAQAAKADERTGEPRQDERSR